MNAIEHTSSKVGLDRRSEFEQRRQQFRRLHSEGCFVIPNPWDVGSARYLQHLGFPALATTSAGFAFSQGLPDSEDDRGFRVVRRHLHAAEVAACDVDIEPPAEFLVERLGAVDVGNAEQNDLELHVDRFGFWLRRYFFDYNAGHYYLLSFRRVVTDSASVERAEVAGISHKLSSADREMHNRSCVTL